MLEYKIEISMPFIKGKITVMDVLCFLTKLKLCFLYKGLSITFPFIKVFKNVSHFKMFHLN